MELSSISCFQFSQQSCLHGSWRDGGTWIHNSGGSLVRTRLRHFIPAVVACVIAAAFGAGTPAGASPISYTFTGVGNGTVNSVAWSGNFTFTFTGDTSNITSGGGVFFQNNLGGTF